MGLNAVYVGELDWLRFQGVWDYDFTGDLKENLGAQG